MNGSGPEANDPHETQDPNVGEPQWYDDLCRACGDPCGWTFVEGHGWTFKHVLLEGETRDERDHYALHSVFISDVARHGARRERKA